MARSRRGAGVDPSYKDDGGNAQGKAAIALQSGEIDRRRRRVGRLYYYLPAGDYGEEGLPVLMIGRA